MGALSVLGKSIGGLIFTISLILLIASVGIVWLTTYDNIKPIALNISMQQFNVQTNSSDLEYMRIGLLMQCNMTGSQTVSVPVGEGFPNLTVNCSDIPEASKLPEVMFGYMFDQIYYKTYDCWFPDCVMQAMGKGGQEAALLLLTAKANSFFMELEIYSYIGIAIGFVLIAASVRRPVRIAKSIGVSMIVTSVPFLLMQFTQGIWPVPGEAADVMGPVINEMMTIMMPYVLAVLAIGIVLLAAGIVAGRRGKTEKSKKEEKKSEKS